MPAVKLSDLSLKRRKLLPFVDISPFFMFFGISGMPGDRQYRIDRRFEQEYYANKVTVSLSQGLKPGRYHLRGLPDEANKRGWTVRKATQATTDLSEDGWQELQDWLKKASRDKTVEPVWIGDLPLF